MANTYEVKVAIADYTSEKNPVFKAKRVQNLPLYILMIWINRHCVHDVTWKNSSWFSGREEDGFYIFDFKSEKDADRCKEMLEWVKNNLVPKSSLIV